MKRLALVFGILALAAGSLSVAQTSTWVPDKAHSGVDFSILHMSLSKVRGHFGNLGGKIVLNEADITKSTVEMTIDVTTVDSGNSMRDNDLKGTNFFDVRSIPDRDICQHQRSEARRWLDGKRQPDSAWRHKAGCSGR